MAPRLYPAPSGITRYARVDQTRPYLLLRSPHWTGYVRTRIEYRWQKLYCYKPQGVYGGVKQYRPYKVIGGSQNWGDITAIHSCKGGVPYAPVSPGNDAWVARDSTSKIKGGVEVEGLKLDVSQENETKNKLTYKAKGSSDAYLCGNNNTILKASRVREIYQS